MIYNFQSVQMKQKLYFCEITLYLAILWPFMHHLTNSWQFLHPLDNSWWLLPPLTNSWELLCPQANSWELICPLANSWQLLHPLANFLATTAPLANSWQLLRLLDQKLCAVEEPAPKTGPRKRQTCQASIECLPPQTLMLIAWQGRGVLHPIQELTRWRRSYQELAMGCRNGQV